MKVKSRSWFCLALLVGVLGLGSASVMAQVSLMVSPIRAEHQVQAGASETNVILVKNDGAKPARIKVYLEDWQMDAKGDVTYFRAGKNPRSCSAWLQLNPTDFRLDPAGTRDVRYTLTVPPGVKPGTYWAAIVLEALPAMEGKPVGRKMGVHGRIGVVIYETVGTPEIKAVFNDFRVRPGKGKLTFNLALTNSGTAFYRLKKSWIILKNFQGQEVSRIEVPDVPVLPGTSRDLEFSKELSLPHGEYLAEAVLDVGRSALLGSKKKFTIGR